MDFRGVLDVSSAGIAVCCDVRRKLLIYSELHLVARVSINVGLVSSPTFGIDMGFVRTAIVGISSLDRITTICTDSLIRIPRI